MVFFEFNYNHQGPCFETIVFFFNDEQISPKSRGRKILMNLLMISSQKIYLVVGTFQIVVGPILGVTFIIFGVKCTFLVFLRLIKEVCVI